MTLKAKLTEMMSVRPGWYRAILEEMAERLGASAARQALGVGDAMPGFILPDAFGELVASSDLLARGPLVVLFARGGWCPFCGETLRQTDALWPAIEAAGGALVALTPDTAGHGLAAQRALGLRFPVLSDVDCAVALQFGAAYRVPPAYRDALRIFGIDLALRHGDADGLLPMPATFVCDRDGIIRFATVSGDITDRTEPEWLPELVRALALAK